MNTASLVRSLMVSLLAAGALLLAGCAVNVPANVYQNMVTYEPLGSPGTVPKTARLEIHYTMTPPLKTYWEKMFNTEQNILNYVSVATDMLARDLTNTGLFAAVVRDQTPADFRLVLDFTEGLEGKSFFWKVKLSVCPPTGDEVFFSREVTHRWEQGDQTRQWQASMPQIMRVLKEGVVGSWQQSQQVEQQRAEQQALASFATMKLEELLASSDRSVMAARERNRALIAAKTTELPGLVRESRTSALTALIVKIEQTILDLNHEAEVAKDRAQQAAAAGVSTPVATPMGGAATEGYLGAELGVLSDARRQELGLPAGVPVVMLARANAGGPAEKAGLQPGDALLEANGRPIASVPALVGLVRQARPGATLQLKVLRDGQSFDRPVVLGTRPATQDPAADNPLEQWRGLAISYRERIELLKPILEVLKQEVTRRNQ
jgi:hypothetical protein